MLWRRLLYFSFWWHRQTLPQVETDKATVAFESVEEGYLAKIIMETGVEVNVGTLVAIVVEV